MEANKVIIPPRQFRTKIDADLLSQGAAEVSKFIKSEGLDVTKPIKQITRGKKAIIKKR